MTTTQKLPEELLNHYQDWQSDRYQRKAALFEELSKGQSPHTMMISCCDSRVHATEVFGAQQGDFFVHRNIANTVPPHNPGGDNYGTSAAIEYAVKALKVQRIVVMGHSACGGVKGCHDMCSGAAPDLGDTLGYVAQWVEMLKPVYDVVAEIEDESERLTAFEKEATLNSIKNLMSFPFVKGAVEGGDLTLHALWIDIGSGRVEQHVKGQGFVPL